MRRSLLAAAFLSLATPALAQRDGIYDVTGTNLDGTPYNGVAQLRTVGIASFNIIWRIGNQLVEGSGMASGRTVAVAYGLAQRPGFAIYTLNPDGSLDGEWTIVGAAQVATERLVPRERPPGAPAPETPAEPPAATRPEGEAAPR